MAYGCTGLSYTQIAQKVGCPEQRIIDSTFDALTMPVGETYTAIPSSLRRQRCCNSDRVPGHYRGFGNPGQGKTPSCPLDRLLIEIRLPTLTLTRRLNQSENEYILNCMYTSTSYVSARDVAESVSLNIDERTCDKVDISIGV